MPSIGPHRVQSIRELRTDHYRIMEKGISIAVSWTAARPPRFLPPYWCIQVICALLSISFGSSNNPWMGSGYGKTVS